MLRISYELVYRVCAFQISLFQALGSLSPPPHPLAVFFCVCSHLFVLSTWLEHLEQATVVKDRVGFWGEGKTRVPGEKPLGARERTENKLNLHMASRSGFEPRPHWWEASVLHTVRPLLSFWNFHLKFYSEFIWNLCSELLRRRDIALKFINPLINGKQNAWYSIHFKYCILLAGLSSSVSLLSPSSTSTLSLSLDINFLINFI